MKNSLGYPEDLYWKFTVAAELDTIPLIIARWLNPAQIPLIKQLGGEYIIFREAIFSKTYTPMIQKVREVLGMPIIALDEIEDNYFLSKTVEMHNQTRQNYESKKDRIKDFLTMARMDRRIQRALGDKRS